VLLLWPGWAEPYAILAWRLVAPARRW
jgi:hypothetical protein